MAKNRKRRQVSGKTPQGEDITIPRVSSNGCANRNARAKGCFGRSPTVPLAQNSKRKVGKK